MVAVALIVASIAIGVFAWAMYREGQAERKRADQAAEDMLARRREQQLAEFMKPEAVEARQKRLMERYNRAVNKPREYAQQDLAPRREDNWSTDATHPLNPLNPIGLTSSWGSDSSSSCGSDYSGGGDSGSCGGGE